MSLKNCVNLALSDSQNTRYPKALQVQSFSSNGQSKKKLKTSSNHNKPTGDDGRII